MYFGKSCRAFWIFIQVFNVTLLEYMQCILYHWDQCMIYTKLSKLCTNWAYNLKNFPSDIIYGTNLRKNIMLHHTKYTTYKILQYNLSKQNDNSRNFRCFCCQIYEKDMIKHMLYSEDMWKSCTYRSYQCWAHDRLGIWRNKVYIFITVRFGKIRLGN